MTDTTSPTSGLPRPVLLLVGFAAAVVAVGGVYAMSGIIGPAFLALMLTVAAQPLRERLTLWGLPGWAGGLVTAVVIYAVLLSLTVAMVVAGARFATILPSYQSDLGRVVRDAVAWAEDWGVSQQQVQELVEALDLGRMVGWVGDVIGGLVGVASSLIFVVTLVLFMAVDGGRFPATLRALPQERHHLAAALRSFAVGTRTYLLVSTVFGLIVAVIDTVALIWIGVPGAVLWGLLAFITNYIPNIGFVIGVIPPAVIGLLEGGPRMMVLVLVTYSVINVVIQSVIQPKVVGDSVGLSSTVTMLSLVFWAVTLGPLGALLAVPLTLLAKALLVDADPRTRWVAPLLSGAPPGPDRSAESTRKIPRGV